MSDQQSREDIVYVPTSINDELPPLGLTVSISMDEGKTFQYTTMGKGWKKAELGYSHWLKPVPRSQLSQSQQASQPTGHMEFKGKEIGTIAWDAELKDLKITPSLVDVQASQPKVSAEEFKNKVAEIMRDNIYFAGQLGDYVIHGAIDKIWELTQSSSPEAHSEGLPTDEEVTNWYVENIDADCSASSAIYKFRLWLKERQGEQEGSMREKTQTKDI